MKGQIGGAALDVFEEEPLALDSQLRNLGDNVLLSPHMVSSNVGSGLGPGIRWATDSVLAALRGEVPDNVYNKDVIPLWQRCLGGKRVWGTRPSSARLLRSCQGVRLPPYASMSPVTSTR